jgi:hypothetical protein
MYKKGVTETEQGAYTLHPQAKRMCLACMLLHRLDHEEMPFAAVSIMILISSSPNKTWEVD